MKTIIKFKTLAISDYWETGGYQFGVGALSASCLNSNLPNPNAIGFKIEPVKPRHARVAVSLGATGSPEQAAPIIKLALESFSPGHDLIWQVKSVASLVKLPGQTVADIPSFAVLDIQIRNGQPVAYISNFSNLEWVVIRNGHPVFNSSDHYSFPFGRRATDVLLDQVAQLKQSLQHKNGLLAYTEVTQFFTSLKNACPTYDAKINNLEEFLSRVSGIIDLINDNFSRLGPHQVSVDDGLSQIQSLIQACYRTNRALVGRYTHTGQLGPYVGLIPLQSGDQVWALTPVGVDRLLARELNPFDTPLTQLYCLDALDEIAPIHNDSLAPGNDGALRPSISSYSDLESITGISLSVTALASKAMVTTPTVPPPWRRGI